jgi:tetratricopeptide (TPR) repeat protein
MMSVLDEVHLHMARAEVHIAEKRKHFELALERLDSLEQIGNFEKNKQGKMTILSSRGDVLINLERWAEALVVCEECQTLCEEGIQNRVVLLKRIDDHEKALNEGRHTDAEEIFLEIKKKKAGGMIFCKPDIDQMRILRDIAICKAETGDYDGALEVYIFKITAVGREARSLQNEKEMEREDFYHMMGMAMCFYHLEDYENAADAGARALLFDRRYRQVHKYAALSMRALGEIEDAIKIIASAISYEAPHDEENRKINIELYQELVRDASTGQ